MSKISELPIVFIINKGRSGSTMIQNILDAHENIIAPLESKFVIHLYSKYKNINQWNTSIKKRFINDLFSNRKIKLFWNLNKTELLDFFLQSEINSFNDACKLVYTSYPSLHKKKDIKLIVDKNPFYGRYIPEILDVFPEAKFIHLVRDPRAVVHSTIAYKKLPFYKVAISWDRLNRIIEKGIKQHPHIRVRYEDITKNPKVEFNKIFSFLGLTYSDEILDGYKQINKNIEKHNYLSLDHHTNTKNPINTKSINAWESNLPEEVIDKTNYICYELGTKYGYKIAHPELSEEDIKKLDKLKVKKKILGKRGIYYRSPFWFKKFVSFFIGIFYDYRYRN